MEEEAAEDRISCLPDCLLVRVLSHLPDTKHAIRTSTLSKRWKHVWHSVPNLRFLNPRMHPLNPVFVSFVDKTLTQRPQFKLNKFTLYTTYVAGIQSHINIWIRYALTCNVEDLSLSLWSLERRTKFPLDDLFFISSCFTNLTLQGFAFNPAGAISWKSLRCLRLSCVKFDHDLVENILSGTPVLETLVLHSCNLHGSKRIDITSKSVKKLVFARCMASGDVIEINAPNILSLTIKGEFWLRNLLLLDVSSLVEAGLDYSSHEVHDDTTLQEETLKGLSLHLPHAKEIKIGRKCFKVLSRLKAKGFIYPSNLKVIGDELQEQVDATTSGGAEDGESDHAS
ncbi:F-box/LRR-repeat protein 25-like [Bidens hawaiensis]|uniref:F-box/LRR-repeat protein 25-like n=1 Tax=Bidens hawaiensis TaxID=980011 RepID=UPI00404B3E30